MFFVNTLFNVTLRPALHASACFFFFRHIFIIYLIEKKKVKKKLEKGKKNYSNRSKQGLKVEGGGDVR